MNSTTANDLREFSLKTGFERNAILSSYGIFNNVKRPNPAESATVIPAGNSYFIVKADAKVIDKGILLPNINSNYKGAAPDLGAMEFDEKAPIYRKRK